MQQKKSKLFLAICMGAVGFVLSCTGNTKSIRSNSSSNRPTDSDETIPGYLESTSKSIDVGEGGDIQIGKTIAKFGEGIAEVEIKVRMSRLPGAPEMDEREALVLSDPEGDVARIDIFDPESLKVLSSEVLQKPYVVSQTIETRSSTESIGLMIISNPGTSEETKTLLKNSQIKIETTSTSADGLKTVIVSAELKVTSTILWVVSYTADAESILRTIDDPSAISSAGGDDLLTADNSTSSSEGGSTQSSGTPWSITPTIAIANGEQYSAPGSVALTLSAADASEMYITNTAGCDTGGTWESFANSKSWTLAQTSGMARVYAKFKNANDEESSCVSDSISVVTSLTSKLALNASQSAGTCSNSSGGVQGGWGSLENALSDDGQWASSVTCNMNSSLAKLRLTGYFANNRIPSAATIDGFELQCKWKITAEAGRVIPVLRFIVSESEKLQITAGTSIGNSTVLSTVYGGGTDKLGWSNPTPAAINSNGFGLEIEGQVDVGTTGLAVDYCQWTVHFH